MFWFIVDVEADGPIPGKCSMVSFGVVLLEPSLSHTFYGQTAGNVVVLPAYCATGA
jgi:hypothetical protein